MNTRKQPAKTYLPPSTFDADKKAQRLYLGEAWMLCNQCGGKLYSFDGNSDASHDCPYQRGGKCDPK